MFFFSPKESSRKLRVLVAKCGLDGYDRGMRVIARAFQEAGPREGSGALRGDHSPAQVMNSVEPGCGLPPPEKRTSRFSVAGQFLTMAGLPTSGLLVAST